MHEVYSAQPTAALRPYVRAYAERHLKVGRGIVDEPVPARLEQTLEFQFADAFRVNLASGHQLSSPTITVIGQHIHGSASVSFTGNVHSFAIFFQPSGLSRLFATPMALLTGLAFEATSVAGPRIRSLWNQLGEAGSFASRRAIAENFLLGLLGNIGGGEPVADRILAARGMIRIADLAADYNCSVRQFERRFYLESGMTPKLCSRIARFQTALDNKVAHPLRSWIRIAHTLGYFDQMHMIQDFKKLGGGAPSTVFAQLGDMRPQALAKSDL